MKKKLQDAFKQQINPWLAKYHHLSQRERIAVVALIFFLSIFLFYKVLWQPIHLGAKQAKQAYDNEVALSVLLKSNEETLKRVSASASMGHTLRDGSTLLSFVTSSAQKRQIQLARFEPKKETLQVWLDQVTLQQIIPWLSDLESQGIVIDSIQIDKQIDSRVTVSYTHLTLPTKA